MAFRICTIGCGAMATRGHGPAYARYAATHPDTVLAACCDLDGTRAARFAATFGFARHYTDLEAMLAAERPDAVCLVVPETLTCELSCRILAQGYPLLMEKPPGRTVEELDRMLAVARRSGAPTQVAFNRRYMPLVRVLKRLLAEGTGPAGIQHIAYDLTRVGRADPDFSLTAIHGVDAVRFLAASDYRHIRFHYRELPALGPGVANIGMDCTMVSGATAHLQFSPLAGVVVERATVHAHDHSFFLHLPVWSTFDGLGRLQHLYRGELALDLAGADLPDRAEDVAANGFYDENAAFFDDLRAGRRPAGDLAGARQSVAVAQCIRERQSEYDAESA